MRVLRLRRRIEQIDRLTEKLSFVITSILGTFSSRGGLYPDLVITDIVINLNGRRFFCRKGTTDWLHVMDFEPETTEFLSRQHGNVFLDIGAHIGRYTVLLAGNFKKVVSAEPFGETFRILSRNVKNNHLRNIVVNKALAETEGHEWLYVHQNLGQCSMIFPSNCRVQVPVTTADFLLRRLGIYPEEVALVKIDVEGAEQRVLRGAQHLLMRGSAKLLVESSQGSEKLKDSLVPFGYSVKCNLDGLNCLLEKS